MHRCPFVLGTHLWQVTNEGPADEYDVKQIKKSELGRCILYEEIFGRNT